MLYLLIGGYLPFFPELNQNYKTILLTHVAQDF